MIKDSTIESRLEKIDEEIEEFKKEVRFKNELYQDESRMRSIIMEHLMPIVNIAKENMITNCNKNSQYMRAQNDVEEVWTKI